MRNGPMRLLSLGALLVSTAPSAAQTTNLGLISPPVEMGIGTTEGEFVRLAGAVRMSDGHVVAADATSQTLRVFDSSGRFIKALGRRGAGPGEFRSINSLGQSGDTLLVGESFGGAVSRLLISSGFAARGPVSPSGTPAQVAPLAFTNTRMVLVSGSGIRATQPPPEGELRQDSIRLGVVDLSRGQLSWLGTFPSRNWLSYRRADAVNGIAMTAHRFSASLIYGSTHNLIWTGDTGSGVLTGFDARGNRQVQIKWPSAPRPLVRAQVSSYIRTLQQDARTGPDSARLAAEHRLDIGSGRAPLLRSIAASSTPEVWVQEFTEDPTAASAAFVFAEDGQLVGKVGLPAGFNLLAVDEDDVLGSRTDEDGFVRVMQYKISRTSR